MVKLELMIYVKVVKFKFYCWFKSHFNFFNIGQLFVDDCESSVISISETQDKQCLLVGCLDSKLRLFDKENGKVLSE